MATFYTYQCNNCDYKVQMSGKPDAIFAGHTTPVVCTDCKHIYDRVTKPSTALKVDRCCTKCRCKEFELWDYKEKKCTKCRKGFLTIEEDGEIILAD